MTSDYTILVMPPRRESDDPHRPRYHFLPPANFMNDPNGLIQWQGRYHLFYQYNPNGPFPGTKHWGHAVSTDLVHWDDLPIALEPTPGGPDEDGCYSGCTVVQNGVPTIIYTGVQGAAQLPCLATSQDDDLIAWRKHPGNPIIAAPPAEQDTVIFRDHAVWPEDGKWYQLVGSGIKDVGGAALLYRSTDLIDWEYLHPISVGDRDQTEPFSTGVCWECPNFFPLGDQHALMVSVVDDYDGLYAAVFLGDYAGLRFTPRTAGIVDFGSSFYAPQVFADERGRQIMFGWLREGRSERAQRDAGWSGVMSLPRVLSLLPDGELSMVPAPEVESLRQHHWRFENVIIANETTMSLDGIVGDCLELGAQVDLNRDSTFGFGVCCAPGGDEETLIVYDGASKFLTLDTRTSTRDEEITGAVQSAHLDLSTNSHLSLRVFLDRSVVEVFANDRICLTERIYPSRPDSHGVRLFSQGAETTLRSLDVWEMRSI